MRQIAHGALLFAGGLAAAMPLSSFASLQTNVVERHYDRFGRPVGVSLNGERRTEIAYDEATGRIASMRVAGAEFAYHYDDIGNRLWSREFGTNCAYVANELNQYTNIVRGGVSELSAFDLDGNQTNVVTATGEWAVEYNGENRPVMWRRKSDGATIRMSYDRLGRRVMKNNETFVYDGYLNVSQTIWDPAEPIATRPLVWRGTGGNAFYFHDGNKNIADFVSVSSAATARHYDYAPFGMSLNEDGSGKSHWRFSSEYAARNLGVTSYLFRDFNPLPGSWMSRDGITVEASLDGALYLFCVNNPLGYIDYQGRCPALLLYPGTWVLVGEFVSVVVESAAVSYLVTYAVEKSVDVYQKYKEECGKCAIDGVDTRTELRQREINRRKLKEKCIDRCWHLLPSRYGDAAEFNRCMRECEAGH